MQSIVTNRVAWSVVRSVTLVSPAKRPNWSRCRFGWGLGWAQGTIIRWGQDPPWEGQFLGKKVPIAKHKDFLPWAVQDRMNRWICRLSNSLGNPENLLELFFLLEIYWKFTVSWKFSGLVCEFARLSLILVTILVLVYQYQDQLILRLVISVSVS